MLSYADPEPVENAPAWLLGRIRWRGWQLPLVSFARLSGIADEQGGLGSKVVVLKALGGDAKLPHFALLTQGFPRLVTVSRDALVVDGQRRRSAGWRADRAYCSTTMPRWCRTSTASKARSARRWRRK